MSEFLKPLKVTIHCQAGTLGATLLQVRMASLLASEGYEVECIESAKKYCNTPKKWQKTIGSLYKNHDGIIRPQKVTIDIDKPLYVHPI